MDTSTPTKLQIPKTSELVILADHYGLNFAQRAVLYYLRSHIAVKYKRFWIFKSQRTLARELGISREYVGRLLAVLRKHGLIETRQKKGGVRNQQEHTICKINPEKIAALKDSKVFPASLLSESKSDRGVFQKRTPAGSKENSRAFKSVSGDTQVKSEKVLTKGQSNGTDQKLRPRDLLTDQQEDRFDLQQLTGPMDRPKYQKRYDKKTREDDELLLIVERMLFVNWNPDAGKCGGGFRRLLRRWVQHVNEYGTAASWNVELKDVQQKVKDAKLLKIIKGNPDLNKLMGQWWITDIKTHIRGIAKERGVSKTEALKLIARKYRHPTSQQSRAASSG